MVLFGEPAHHFFGVAGDGFVSDEIREVPDAAELLGDGVEAVGCTVLQLVSSSCYVQFLVFYMKPGGLDIRLYLPLQYWGRRAAVSASTSTAV